MPRLVDDILSCYVCNPEMNACSKPKSLNASVMYTEPTRNTLSDRCARAPSGHASVVLARTAMNSRRLIEPPNPVTDGGSISGCFAASHADGASRMVQVAEDSFGSWSCENAEGGSLTDFGCGATTLREV